MTLETEAESPRCCDEAGEAYPWLWAWEELAALCRRYDVARLEVFGSAARGEDFSPETSDADFLVEFGSAAPRTLDRYFDLRDALRDALGRPVDLVELRAVRNPYLRASINRSRELVYRA